MSRRLWIRGEKGVWSQPASGRSGRTGRRGWGTEQRQGKVWVTEDSRQKKPCGSMVRSTAKGNFVLGGQTVTLKARDSPSPAVGTEEGWWVAELTRGGWVMQPSFHALEGQSATLEHVRPFPVTAFCPPLAAYLNPPPSPNISCPCLAVL